MGKAKHSPNDAIHVRGAAQNNLKDVSLDLPLNRLVGIAGLSGSGKSSLVHHVIGATGSRRLGRLRFKPSDLAPAYGPLVREVGNLPACIEVRQEPLRGQSRSTVATYSGIMDALAQLFTRHGTMQSPRGEDVLSLDQADLGTWLLRHYRGSSVAVAEVRPDIDVRQPRQLHDPKAVFCRERNGLWKSADDAFSEKLLPAKLWVANVRDSVCIRDLESARKIVRQPTRDFLWIIDNRVFLEGGFSRVAADIPEPYLPPSRRLFSFNSVAIGSGRCPKCDGMGMLREVSEQTLIRDADRPILDDGLNLPKSGTRFTHLASLDCVLRGLFKLKNLPLDISWAALPREIRQTILNGSGREQIPELHDAQDRLRPAKRAFVGLVELITMRAASTAATTNAFSGLITERRCSDCDGTRLNRSTQACNYRDTSITSLLVDTTLDELCEKIATWATESVGEESATLMAVGSLLQTCVDLNLGYLNLGRTTSSVSGGEAQRIRLAIAMAVELLDCCYLLDEPSRALHAKDVSQLGVAISRLAERNTVLMVEHHPLLLKSVDELVVMGPGGGIGGGSVIYQGNPRSAAHSVSASALGSRTRPSLSTPWIKVAGLTINNVKNAVFQIPTKRLTLVVGVSGAGKSSAILSGLVPATKAALEGVEWQNGRLQLPKSLQFVEVISQKMGSQTRRSVVATHLGLYDAIRDHFASQEASKSLGLDASDFSFNSRGACPACEGSGVARDGFGNETNEVCHACAGRRLSDFSLLVQVWHSSIADLLNETISELSTRGHPALDESAISLLHLAADLGLGHLQMSRAASTLSAGERQRLGLVRFLGRVDDESGVGLLVLDEPTAGLSALDAQRVFRRLAEHAAATGHTLVAIEHKLELIAESDWIIEFGPVGGPSGGKVVFQGPSAELSKAKTPTAQMLNARSVDVQAGGTPRRGQDVGHGTVQDTDWHSQAAAFEKLIGSSELTAEAEIPRPLVPAIAIHPGRVPPDARVAEMLDLLPCIRALAQPKLPPEVIAAPDMNIIEKHVDGHSFGFSPVSLQRRLGLATPSDWADATSRLIRSGFNEVWFDGRTYSLKKFTPLLKSPAELLEAWVVCAREVSSATRQIALRWSQGVVRLMDGPGKGQMISTRFLSGIDAGGAFGVQFDDAHAGDCRSFNGRCSMCDGQGVLAAYPIELIVADGRKTIDDDRFWQPSILNAIRSLRRVRLIPEAKFFAAQLVADFFQPIDRMAKRTRQMFEHGIPWRRFPKPSAKRTDRVQDHYFWRGLHDSVYEVFGAIEERQKQRLKDAFRMTECESCNGTGIGWEAQSLALGKDTLFKVLSSRSLEYLRDQCKVDSPSLVAAIALGLGHLRCSDRYSGLDAGTQRSLLVALCKSAPLRKVTVIMDDADSPRSRLASKLLSQDEMTFVRSHSSTASNAVMN